MGTYLFHPVVLTKTVMMRKASHSNGDKLPFLILHPSGLLSRGVTKFVDVFLRSTACCPVLGLSEVWDADQV